MCKYLFRYSRQHPCTEAHSRPSTGVQRPSGGAQQSQETGAGVQKGNCAYI